MSAFFLFLVSSLSTVAKFAGAGIALTGLSIFGFYFIRENGRSARKGMNSVPTTAWRGKGPVKGLRFMAYGALLVGISIAVSFLLPSAAGV